MGHTFRRTQVRDGSYHAHDFHFQPLCLYDPISFWAPVGVQSQANLTAKPELSTVLGPEESSPPLVCSQVLWMWAGDYNCLHIIITPS